jgi:hypothetical protein
MIDFFVLPQCFFFLKPPSLPPHHGACTCVDPAFRSVLGL